MRDFPLLIIENIIAFSDPAHLCSLAGVGPRWRSASNSRFRMLRRTTREDLRFLWFSTKEMEQTPLPRLAECGYLHCLKSQMTPDIISTGFCHTMLLASAAHAPADVVLSFMQTLYSMFYLKNRHYRHELEEEEEDGGGIVAGRRRSKFDSMHIGAMLSQACKTGNLTLVQWIVETFEITDEVFYRNNLPLRNACCGGHIEIARFLAEKFALTLEDARSDENAPLRGAACGGHFAVVQWLCSAFALTGVDVRSRGNYAFRFACAGGYLDVAIFLADAYAMTNADASAGGDFALREAGVNGHKTVVEFLRGRFVF